MTIEIFLLWFIVWIVFLVMSIIETKGVTFAFLAGIYPMFLGIYIFLDGIQIQQGLTTTFSGGTQHIEKVYVDTVPPFSSYGILFGIPFILLGIYICFLAANKNR